MDSAQFESLLVEFMMSVAILAGNPLAIATFLGFVVALLQAFTQIQDQTLSQTLKIAAIETVLLAFGSSLSAPLMISTTKIFAEFGTIK